MAITLTKIGEYRTGVFDDGAAEIVAFDAASQRLFVINANAGTVDVLDVSDPTTPTPEPFSPLVLPAGFEPNSVAVSDGLVAVAAAADPITDMGKVVFFAADGTFLGTVDAGANPDMITFSPDGTRVLVANEGEPADGVDPDGSVTIITLGAGPALADKVSTATTVTATFDAFDARIEELRYEGVRIADGTTVSQDLEPEYIALTGDGSLAVVTLQENNALAYIDVATGTVRSIVSLGVKDHANGEPTLTEFPITDRPDLGTTALGQTIKLGGFSGLWFSGVEADTGRLLFTTVPDRGPNGDPINVDGDAAAERPFLLPDYQARVVNLAVDPATGDVEILDQILLTRQDGTTPITGLPNIPGFDEEPIEITGVDSTGAVTSFDYLPYDAYGADLEGIVVATDGTFWMVDEYRPAIYHFSATGVLINRFVPEGTAALATPDEPAGTFGDETLPADYSTRRANRGFEAIAYDPDAGIIYAFIQTPLNNPSGASGPSTVIRILGVDTATGTPVSEYVYLLEKPVDFTGFGDNVDKIGDATYLGDGKFAVAERGDSLDPAGQKFIFQIDITGATNLLDPAAPALLPGQTLEQHTAEELAAAGIVPVNKIEIANLPTLGYLPSDKVEGLAVLPDGSLAVLNDNDFALFAGTGDIALGLITFDGSDGLDGSDRDGPGNDGAINIQDWPVYGLYQADAIASYEVNGATYFVMANEGDGRDAEIARLRDVVLDPTAFPNAAQLQDNDGIGRLEIVANEGDLDGDGDLDQIFAYGGRSFTIRDINGNIVFDSGSDFERIIAERFPDQFNSTNTENDSFDTRSDNKGPEPEGVAIGQVGDRTYAFIGLERMSGVMIYDITSPTSVKFVDYINPRDFAGDPEADTAGDLGPEGLAFIPASQSPTGRALLAVGNEISGSTAIFEIVAQPVINEFVANHTGSDTNEFIEIKGDAGVDYSGYSILQIEGDGAGAGTIDSVTAVGTTDANGYWTSAFLNSIIENGTLTLLLVRDFTGTVGMDIDTDNDGVADTTPWEAVFDAVAVSDGTAGDLTYTFGDGPTLGIGYDGQAFSPGGASRIPDGTDTDAAADWVRNDFDGAGLPGFTGTPVAGEALNTPGAPNALATPAVTSAAIYEIQGAGHTSAFVGQQVQTSGIVTGFRLDTESRLDGTTPNDGFYIQDPTGDGNDATSDGILIFTGSTDPRTLVTVGDLVSVTGSVSEFRSSSRTSDLTLTEITGPSVSVMSSGHALPDAVVIGTGGRVPPATVIDDDGLASFDPTTDGIDFYESLEGMRVQVNDAVVVGGTSGFGEITVLADDGAGVDQRTSAGGVHISAGDFNPERILIDDYNNFGAAPQVSVGDTFDAPIVGHMDYTFGNFKLINDDPLPSVTPTTVADSPTALTGDATHVTIATFNVENLDPNDADGDADIANGQFDHLAAQIVGYMLSPDIIGLQEIQDNSGSVDDGVTDASLTYQTLIDAITAAGGPTYEFIDIAPVDGTNGGQPGANIRVGFLYNPARVSVDAASAELIDPTNPALADSRKPLAVDFEFNGETITVITNHLNSKGGDDPLFGSDQPPVLSSEVQRLQQAQVINDYVDAILAGDADANVVVLGDLNDFEFSPPLATLTGGVLTDLTGTVPGSDRYTYNFDGNSQVLDHILVSDALLGGASVDILHVNSDYSDSEKATDHDPIVASVQVGTAMPDTFTLQLLHFSDQEGNIAALDDAPRLSGVLNALRDDYANTLTLSSGDEYIPGVFLSASQTAFGGVGRADILIANELGVQASAFGNHEFDLNTALVKDLIGGATGFPGTSFPYLSGNLDFSTDANLSGLVVPPALAPLANSITASVVFDVNGEDIGVVGATTPLLRSISSPGNVGVAPIDFDSTDPADLDALAAVIQEDVDALLAANPGLNKVILLAHMQQISVEEALATRLHDVDIIVAGGSDTLLSDPTDPLREGDVSQGTYPYLTTDADGNPIAVVNTDGNYKYVGRLVVDFDMDGHIVPDSIDENVSGAYATDDAGVAALNAESLIDPEIVAITDQLRTVIQAQDGAYFGVTDVFLNGQRNDVRTQETNLGDLSADANLALGKQYDPDVVISIKNGGGIRNYIGKIETPTGGTEPAFLPPDGNPLTGRPDGGISQIDIQNALAFNNGLSIVSVTASELLAILEHAVAATEPGATPGQFAQVGGIEYSFDATLPVGERVQSVAIVDESGHTTDIVAVAGEVVGDPDRLYRMITLDFMANGGDGYPIPDRDRVDITDTYGPRDGLATFAPNGSEQDALAEFLAANYPEASPYDQADVPPALDERIQNLGARSDGVFDAFNVIAGSDADNALPGTAADDLISGGAGNDSAFGSSGDDLLFGGAGDDTLAGGAGNDSLSGDAGNDSLSGKSGDDTISGGAGDDNIRGDIGNDSLAGDAGNDSIGGGAGDDTITGGESNDILRGEAGEDRIDGGDGDDRVAGNDGDDLLFGGAGSDTIVGGEGNDILTGGDGDDTFVITNEAGTDIITDFITGEDQIRIVGFGITDFSTLSGLFSEFGGATQIDLGTDVDVLVLGKTPDQLAASDFVLIA